MLLAGIYLLGSFKAQAPPISIQDPKLTLENNGDTREGTVVANDETASSPPKQVSVSEPVTPQPCKENN